MRDEEFGRGQNPSWAGTTPLFGRLRGQSDPWGRSSPAQRKRSSFARAQSRNYQTLHGRFIKPCIKTKETKYGNFEIATEATEE
jgi:hypothetical protein